MHLYICHSPFLRTAFQQWHNSLVENRLSFSQFRHNRICDTTNFVKATVRIFAFLSKRINFRHKRFQSTPSEANNNYVVKRGIPNVHIEQTVHICFSDCTSRAIETQPRAKVESHVIVPATDRFGNWIVTVIKGVIRACVRIEIIFWRPIRGHSRR